MSAHIETARRSVCQRVYGSRDITWWGVPGTPVLLADSGLTDDDITWAETVSRLLRVIAARKLRNAILERRS
jgi:hypothetical protein